MAGLAQGDRSLGTPFPKVGIVRQRQTSASFGVCSSLGALHNLLDVLPSAIVAGDAVHTVWDVLPSAFVVGNGVRDSWVSLPAFVAGDGVCDPWVGGIM